MTLEDLRVARTEGATPLVCRYPLHLDIAAMNEEEAELQERWGCEVVDEDDNVC